MKNNKKSIQELIQSTKKKFEIQAIKYELKKNIINLPQKVYIVKDPEFKRYKDFFSKIPKKALENQQKINPNLTKEQNQDLDDIQEIINQEKTNSSQMQENLPGTKVSLPALTQKDKEDAKFAIKEEVDWIALSFVRHAKDIEELRKLIKENSPSYEIPIVSKIEKPEAIEDIDEIIECSDAIMVARGDLGVEIPIEKVPLIQKKLIAKAKLASIPVIVATQMMESMIENMTPTRAEVNDVANSVLDGADALMLSAETSVGKYPLEVIAQMSKVIKETEDNPSIEVSSNKSLLEKETHYIEDKIFYVAANLAKNSKAKAIILLESQNNRASFEVSSYRPLGTYILVFTDNKKNLNKLNLLWGVKAFFYEKKENLEQCIKEINQLAKKTNWVCQGDYIINLYQNPLEENSKEINSILLNKV